MQKVLEETIALFNQSYVTFCELNHDAPDERTFEGRVLDFNGLYKEALLTGGNAFLEKLAAKEEEMKEKLLANTITLPDAAIQILEFAADEADLEGPTEVIGLSGPYYPHITNSMLPNGEDLQLGERVDRISQDLFKVEYQSNAYFMGISDLSYAGTR